MNVPGHAALLLPIHLYNKGMGGVHQMDCLFTRLTVGGPRQKLLLATLSRLSTQPWSLPGALRNWREPSFPPEFQERSDYTFSRWINHNQLQGRRLVEENLPFNSMPNGVRRDCNGHQKEPWTQRRCKVCKKTARYKCRKCGVRIHPDKELHVVKRFTDKN